ncbi:hypothetical protein P5X00_36380 [Paraburkholderia sp. A2RO-4L]|uniref:hypothetical protein n=1 Tax=Paraburkholderia sp. A2RO-4L TaxID=3028374 RepID=UPI0032F0E2DF|nr:hypothetical protein [Burkholderia vietnamiensis]
MPSVARVRAVLVALALGLSVVASHAEQPRTRLVLTSPRVFENEIPGDYPVVFDTLDAQRCRLGGIASMSWRRPDSLLQRLGAYVTYLHDGLMPFTAVHLDRKDCLTPTGWIAEAVDLSIHSWGTLGREED